MSTIHGRSHRRLNPAPHIPNQFLSLRESATQSPHIRRRRIDTCHVSFHSMAAYLWLIWYDASTKAAPKHWTLAVSYEPHDRAYATVYEVSNAADLGGYAGHAGLTIHTSGRILYKYIIHHPIVLFCYFLHRTLLLYYVILVEIYHTFLLPHPNYCSSFRMP